MSKLHKLSLSLLMTGGLLTLSAANATEMFQLAQTDTTFQQNTTAGGGNREMVDVENSARQENEGNPGNPNHETRVDARDVATVDFNDNEGGAYDLTFIGIMLIVAALLTVLFLSSWRVHRPVDVYND